MKASRKMLLFLFLPGVFVQMLAIESAFAAADLMITKMKMATKARQGACNQIALTITNLGDRASLATKGMILTHPKDDAKNQRSTLWFDIAPLKSGESQTMIIPKIRLQPFGVVVVQSVINNPATFKEGKLGSNDESRTIVVLGACPGGSLIELCSDAICDAKRTISKLRGDTV